MKTPHGNTREIIINTVKSQLRTGESTISMSQIAKASKISKSSLYYFFTDKNDLLATVVLSLFEECELSTEDILESTRPADEKLLFMMEVMAEMAQKESAITHFIFREILRENAIFLKKIFERRILKKKLFIKILEEGKNSNVFRTFDSEKTSEILLGMLDFCILTNALPVIPPTDHQKLFSQLIFLLRI